MAPSSPSASHGPVVSVTTYRDAGFLPRGFHQLPLPARLVAQERPRVSHPRRAHRRLHSRRRQPRQRRLNFTEEDPFDAKAVWLNAEHIRALPVEELGPRPPALLRPGRLSRHAGESRSPSPRSSASASSCCAMPSPPPTSSSCRQLAPYDPAELIPPKGGDAALARRVLQTAQQVLATTTSITIRSTTRSVPQPLHLA